MAFGRQSWSGGEAVAAHGRTTRAPTYGLLVACRATGWLIDARRWDGEPIGVRKEVERRMSLRGERDDTLDRFNTPLYTTAEAARYLDVPASTLNTWAHGYRRKAVGWREVIGAPVLTALPRVGVRGPIIPFIGLAEGLVLTAMRRSGVTLQRIRPR